MKRIRSLSVKNFINTARILLVSFVLTGVAFSLTLYRYIYRENIENMSSALTQTVRIVSAYSSQWGLDDIEIRMSLSSTASLTGCDILVADENGTVVSCSDRALNCPHMGLTLPETLMEHIPSKNAYGGTGRLEGLYSGQRQYVAVMLPGQDGAAGYMVMSVGLETYRSLWREYSSKFVLVAGAVLLLAFVVTVISSRHQTEPINEMAAAASRFGRGELEVRVRESGRLDEIGQLARSFNAMADSLENTEQSRRELISNVSHDLKTPITTISGFSDGILDGTIPPEKEREYLSAISSEAKRMSRMVQNMLTMSRIQAVDPAEILRGSFDICEIMRVCLLGLEGRIEEKHLEVELTLPEEEIITRGEKDAITRVLTNLMDNAVKFADPGTVLTLEVWKQGGKAYVSVQNCGATIPPEELPRIFERFHKGDSSRNLDKSGSGLGLFIVKSILNSHREDIFVASENGVTRFIFTLSLRPSDKG